MKQYLLNRLQEPSTWRGLVWVVTSLGVYMSPETIEQVIVAGTTMTGLIGMITGDNNPHG